MKYFYLIIFFSFSTFSLQAQNQRKTYNFNPGWKLFVGDPEDAKNVEFDDNSWKSFTLPHAWNEDEAFKKSIEQLSTGIAWYRKHFKVEGSKDHKVFIEFEGIRQAGEFYLNGVFIGRHENGVTAFGFDISDLIQPEKDNVLAVRIDNAWNYKEKATNSGYQWSDKNFNANYGGISKNVRLHLTGKIYQTLPLNALLKTTGNYIYAKNFDITGKKAVIVSESQVRNETSAISEVQYEVQIKDASGKVIKTFQATAQNLAPGTTAILKAEAMVEGLHFWSWGYGYLYTVTSRIKINGNTVDELNTKTGFRKAEFKDGMVYLNDRVLMMKGYAQRTSNGWPAIGLSVPAWLSDYSNQLMVESNANLVRWMHIAPWKQDVESCDRVGLIQAMPAGDAEKDVTGTRWDQRKSVMTDAIIYNRNNPSILFYECGNESISAVHMDEMKAIRNQYDPNGGRAIGSREMLDIPSAEYGGEMLYINKSASKPLWSMEYSRDEGLRKYWDEFSPPFHKDGAGPLYKGADASIYNRNQDTHAIENVVRWNEYYKERPGTGKRVSSGGVNIIFSDSNTHYRGEENYRRSGEVDAMRIPKDGFYAHKVIWDGWVDTKKTGIHIIGHWNYKAGIKKDIHVIAAGDKTELFVNGKSLGFGAKRDGFLYTFKDVTYKSGSLKAISYDDKGIKLAEKQIKTAGTPVAIKLTKLQHPTGFKADGADLALVQVEVIDAEGNRNPIALNLINFKISGPAEWRGGLAQGPDNYILSKQLPVEGGVNRVLIRSTKTPGKINITAKADGLKSATIILETLPVNVTGGLSVQFPADGLKSNLQRGETPVAQTYQMSRTPVNILSASAGANTEKAKLSYDDNELSDWVNDGNLNTAWIKY
ncbi:MAG: glycoside hydrolase family 2 protein, partial [Pedobacter sp.]